MAPLALGELARGLAETLHRSVLDFTDGCASLGHVSFQAGLVCQLGLLVSAALPPAGGGLLGQPLARVERATATALDSFIANERPIALQGVLNNIGPSGSKVAGAGAGFVMASPSKDDPNCEQIEREPPPATKGAAR